MWTEDKVEIIESYTNTDKPLKERLNSYFSTKRMGKVAGDFVRNADGFVRNLGILFLYGIFLFFKGIVLATMWAFNIARNGFSKKKEWTEE